MYLYFKVFFLLIWLLLVNSWIINVVSFQFGIAMGFLIPPILVQKGEDVEQRLYTLFIGVAVLCSVLLVLVLICGYRTSISSENKNHFPHLQFSRTHLQHHHPWPSYKLKTKNQSSLPYLWNGFWWIYHLYYCWFHTESTPESFTQFLHCLTKSY